MSSHRYSAQSYDDLADPRARRLFDWLIKYSAQHDGRRASRAEMRAALDIHRETLNNLLSSLELAGLLEFEADARGLARYYRLPDARWTHPHLATLASRKAFYVGTLLDQ